MRRYEPEAFEGLHCPDCYEPLELLEKWRLRCNWCSVDLDVDEAREKQAFQGHLPRIVNDETGLQRYAEFVARRRDGQDAHLHRDEHFSEIGYCDMSWANMSLMKDCVDAIWIDTHMRRAGSAPMHPRDRSFLQYVHWRLTWNHQQYPEPAIRKRIIEIKETLKSLLPLVHERPMAKLEDELRGAIVMPSVFVLSRAAEWYVKQKYVVGVKCEHCGPPLHAELERILGPVTEETEQGVRVSFPASHDAIGTFTVSKEALANQECCSE